MNLVIFNFQVICMYTISVIFTDFSFCDNVKQSDDCMIDTRDESNKLQHKDKKYTEKKKNTGLNFSN